MSSGRFENIDVYVTPPTVCGASKTPKVPQGCRAVAVTAVAAETALTGDIFLALPDPSGNQATSDFIGPVLVRVFADGGDLCILFGPAGAGITPDPAAMSPSANVCDIIPSGMFYEFMLEPQQQRSMYLRTRTGTATARYRLTSPLPGNR